MKLNKALLGTAFFMLVFLGSCTYTISQGPVIEKELSIEPFEGAHLDGSFDVSIEQGAIQKVVAVGQKNIIEKLRLDVKDGILYISLEPGSYFNFDLEVKLTIPTIKSVSLDGSGDIKIGTFVQLNDLNVTLEGSGDIESEGALEVTGKAEVALDGSGDIDLRLKANEVSADLEGSGDVELEGSCSDFLASLEGSGDIKAFSLEAKTCETQLEGSGTIKVFATKKLKAKLDGSGDIRYRGNPNVEADISGSGSVSGD